MKIEIVQWIGNLEEVLEFCGSCAEMKISRRDFNCLGELETTRELVVHTKDGDKVAEMYDYIIKDSNGDFYPINPKGKNNIFLRVPCGIGDDVYSIPDRERYKLNIFNGFTEENCVRHYIVEEISFDKSGWRLDCEIDGEPGYTILLDNEFNKTWFLSEKDAEEALELVNAGGDIVELPCNPGDTIYVISNCGFISPILDGDMYDGEGGPGDATDYYCPYELNGKCPHNVDNCEDSHFKEAVFEDTVDSITITEYGMEIIASLTQVRSSIGRDIFHTIEEAQENLNKRNKTTK